MKKPGSQEFESRLEAGILAATDSPQLDLFNEESRADVKGLVIQGDARETKLNLREWSPEVLERGLDLVYIDPPFNNDENFKMNFSMGQDSTSTVSVPAFSDRWTLGIEEYLEMLKERLVVCHEILAPSGWLAVHVDWKTDYRVRQLLNEIFGGPDFWRNTIYWRRDPGGKGNKARTKQFPRNCDSIILFNKSLNDRYFSLPRLPLTEEQQATYRNVDDDGERFKAVDARNYSSAAIAEMSQQGDIYVSSTGKPYKKYYLVDAEGVVDMLWTDIPGFGVRTGAAELIGYPTQKPIALLERIITSLCPPGGWIGDFFCGSGTTAVAARDSGRNFVVADVSSLACELTKSRLMQQNTSRGCSLRVVSTAGGRDFDSKRVGSDLPALPLRIDGAVKTSASSIDVRGLSLSFSADTEVSEFLKLVRKFFSEGSLSSLNTTQPSDWIASSYILSDGEDGGLNLLGHLEFGQTSNVPLSPQITRSIQKMFVAIVDCFGRRVLHEVDFL